MNWPDVFLLCFAVGVLWSLASLLLGGMHLGHTGPHIGHGYLGHAPMGHGHLGNAGIGHAHASGHAPASGKFVPPKGGSGWLASMINPSCAAVFLAWFGGIGYLLTRHSGLAFWVNLAIAIAMGLGGAWILAAFLRFLQSREKPLDPADYEMIGVLGRVSCPIRPEGVGEVIYVQDGARKSVPARSEDGTAIEREREVVVTRFDRGTAYVRTWEAMTQ